MRNNSQWITLSIPNWLLKELLDKKIIVFKSRMRKRDGVHYTYSIKSEEFVIISKK